MQWPNPEFEQRLRERFASLEEHPELCRPILLPWRQRPKPASTGPQAPLIEFEYLNDQDRTERLYRCLWRLVEEEGEA